MENKEIKTAEIDEDVVKTISEADILKSVENDTQMKRALLNFVCETISQLKEMSANISELQNILSICSNDKMYDYLCKVQAIQKKEIVKEKIKDKIKQSHLQSEKLS